MPEVGECSQEHSRRLWSGVVLPGDEAKCPYREVFLEELGGGCVPEVAIPHSPHEGQHGSEKSLSHPEGN